MKTFERKDKKKNKGEVNFIYLDIIAQAKPISQDADFDQNDEAANDNLPITSFPIYKFTANGTHKFEIKKNYCHISQLWIYK